MAKPATTHIRFCTPFSKEGGHCEVYLTKEHAIAIQQKLADERKYIYPTPDDALKDFMTVNWAEWAPEPREHYQWVARLELAVNTMSADLAGYAAPYAWVKALLLKAHHILYPENKPKGDDEGNQTKP